MDRLTVTPLLRGAFLQAGGSPVSVLFQDNPTPGAPDLPTPFPGDVDEKALSQYGAVLRDAVGALADESGSFPAQVTIPGIGGFVLGAKPYQAEQAKGRDLLRFKPELSGDRSEVVKNRIALVTGGAQGFGAEITRGLVDAGAFVIVADINEIGAQAFVDELNAGSPQRAAALGVDVSDEESVKNMAASVVDIAGGLDLVVSNAGVLRAGSVLELEAKDFDFVTKINYSAFFLVVKHLATVMVRQSAAASSWKTDILQINSKSGLAGSNKNGAYAGGKFGGIGLVQSFALELVEYGVKVNAVCPGNFFDGPLWSDPEKGLFVQYLNTGKVPGAKSLADVKAFYEAKVPMGRGCEGPDVLKAILYCVEQQYETGQAVPVTGGQIMLK